jgi:hypothetical protein
MNLELLSKRTRVLLLVLGGAIAAAGSHAAWAARQDTPPKSGAAQFLHEELSELGKVRLEAAQKTFDLLFKPFRTGMGSRPETERVYDWSKRWLDAELENCSNDSLRAAAYERHLERMKELQGDVKSAQSRSRDSSAQITAVDYYRAEAAFWVVRAKAK